MRHYNVGTQFDGIALDVVGPSTITDSDNEYIGRFGVITLKLYFDQRGNFESTMFQKTCALLGIQKTRTTLSHGMVKRFNSTLQSKPEDVCGWL